MMKRLLLLALFLVAGQFMAPAASAQDDADQSIAVFKAFYAQRDLKPVWTDKNKFTNRGRALPAILAGAAAHGIDPEAYGVPSMVAMLEGQGQPADLKSWQEAELAMTYGLWRYASDLMGQDIDAQTLASLVDGDIEDNLQALGPSQPLYAALKDRLAELDHIIANENLAGVTENPKIEFGKRGFKPGMSHPNVPKLRALMKPFGAPELLEATPEAQANVYDETLAKAVGRFQQEYGLKSDGSIGPETLKILNRDPRTLRKQVVANMQRLREPHRRLREDTRIEVSIARYWLTGYKGGQEAISMPVIVGKPVRQTISFRTEISGVRLNPAWHVPPTIKKQDFLPMLVKDPAKLVRMHGVKVVHGGRNVDPTSVEWGKMTPRELSQVGFWRPAGDGNPLGRYRVIMENPYDIYLHDTNHPDLFEGSYRAQSSGCVRVSKPQELTEFLLSTKAGWTPQKTEEIVKSGRTFDVVMENKMPIYLDYMTAWFNSLGQVILGTDVYGLDAPRYDGLVKHALTTQRNTRKILDRVTDILSPELQEAHHRDLVLTQSTN